MNEYIMFVFEYDEHDNLYYFDEFDVHLENKNLKQKYTQQIKALGLVAVENNPKEIFKHQIVKLLEIESYMIQVCII